MIVDQYKSLFKQLQQEIATRGLTQKSKNAKDWFTKRIAELNGSPIQTKLFEMDPEEAKDANVWIKRRVRDYRENTGGTINRAALLSDPALNKRARPKPGEMYMYVYDAKHKDTLPYYDRFPLIILVGPAEGGFYGLNLHYLHPLVRAAFLDKLIETTMTGYSESAKLRITYELLKKAKRYREFGPCFKHYLFSQVDTKFSKVEVGDWPIAIFLPTEHFAGATKQKVWADSKKKYQKS